MKNKLWAWASRAAAGAGLLALSVGLAQADVSNACVANNINVSQGSIFSTFSGGQVLASQTGSGYSCLPTFYSSPSFNVASGSYAGPAGSGGCKNATTGTAISASGQSAAAIALPAFQASSQAYDYSYSGSAHTLTAGGSSGGQIILLPYNVTWNGRGLTVPAYGATATVPAAVYSDWGTVSSTNGAMIIIQANPSNTRIDTLTLSNCGSTGGAALMPGNYFVNTLNIGAGCPLSVAGAGAVNLYVNNAFALSTGTCLNWTGSCGAAITASSIAAQTPASLRVWANSSVTVNGAVQAAAALYAASGSVSFNQSGAAAWVGETAAPNINFANAAGAFAYANTGAFTGAAPVRKGVYSLSAPAVPAVAATGDYVYFAEQQDATATGQSSIGGHLYANALNADGSVNPSPAWDAANLMTVSNRANLLVTQAATGGLANLSSVANNLLLLAVSLVGTLLGNGLNAINALIDPNWQGGSWLSGRDSTNLLGRPMGSAPVIANKIVVMGTDDGFLYGFDKKTGQLKWGYFPPENLVTALVPGALLGSQPWGQLAYYRVNNVDYVLATGLQGSLHLALALDPNGNLSNVAWKDYQAGSGSPSSPAGGAAPTMAIDQTGSAAGKVAYIVNNTLVRRSIADGSGAQSAALPNAATSNLIYVNDTQAYYGDSAGNVKGALGAGDVGSLGQSPVLPVQYLTGAYSTGIAGGTGLALIGASSTKAQAFAVGSTSAWTTLWQVSAASSAGAPSLASGAAISSMPTISNNLVFLGTTQGSSICTQQAQEIGPLALLSGAPALANTTFRTVPVSSVSNTLGVGQTTFATAGTLNGKSFIFADSNGGGSASPATGWGQYTLAPAQKAARNMRLNWRELTNFITARFDASVEWAARLGIESNSSAQNGGLEDRLGQGLGGERPLPSGQGWALV